MKHLLGILVLDRPKTLELCLHHLLMTDNRKDFTIVLIDNHSNEATQEVIRKYEKDVDEIIHNEWNYGFCFGMNQWLSMRDLGQHCIQADQDLIMKSGDWWEMVAAVLQDKDIGMVAARRPTAWIDREDKRQGYKELYFEKRHGLWLEIPRHNFLISPITVYKGELLDQTGFENEATGFGDMEFPYRVYALGYKSVYIPDIFLYHLENDFEVYNHPQRGAHKDLLRKNLPLHQRYVNSYMKGQKLYCGTRFLPLTMLDEEYTKYSDENWEFHRNWRMP